MLIDWFTVCAQALNFIILVWLLKRYLYKPILDAVDSREKRIAAELANADAKKTEAKKERDEFQHKNDTFDQQRAALLGKATQEASAERQRLLDEAREAADNMSTKRSVSLLSDAKNLNQAILQRTQQEVFAIARKALQDLAGANLEERMCDVFMERLQKMDAKSKADLAKALSTASAPAIIRSAFDLPPAQRLALQKVLNEIVSADLHVQFESAPTLVSGIEFVSNGQKVAWSISDYLGELEKAVGDLLNKNSAPTAKVTALPDTKSVPKEAVQAAPRPDDTQAGSKMP